MRTGACTRVAAFRGMPRKQRFKPSRKPKPAEPAPVSTAQEVHPDDVDTEVEHAVPARDPGNRDIEGERSR